MEDLSKQMLCDCKSGSGVGSGTSGGITTGEYTLLTGKGLVKKVAVVFASDTIADLAQIAITLSYNNTQVINNVTGTLLNRTMQGVQVEFPVAGWVEGSKINYTVTNAGATAIPFSIFFYYAPEVGGKRVDIY